MHYILGTTFPVAGIVRGSSSPEVLMANRGARLFNETGEFELFYIRPRTDSNGDRVVTYTFKNLDTGTRQDIDFKTTREADSLIATLLKENIPDYTKIYEEMSD